MEYQKYLLSREPKEIELTVDNEILKLKLRQIPWSLKNQLVSLHSYRDDEGKLRFDSDGYIRGCLKYMIVEAPWGDTTDIFLTQLGDNDLSSALESIVPGPWEAKTINREELKKGLNPS